MLRPSDEATLRDSGLRYEVAQDGGFVAVIIRDFPLPSGLAPRVTDLLVRLPPGFPDAGPDMFWVSPALHLPGGGGIPGTQAHESYLGSTWQRWSRHISNQWRPGVDNLATYMAYIRRCLDQAAGKAA